MNGGGRHSITIKRIIEGESIREDNLIPGASPALSPFHSVHAHSRGLLQEEAYVLSWLEAAVLMAALADKVLAGKEEAEEAIAKEC